MAWTRDTTTGTVTLASGGDRFVWNVGIAHPPAFRRELTVNDVGNNIALDFYMSPDGLTSWQVVTDSTNISIRRLIDGQADADVDVEAHGIGAGPATIILEVKADVFTARVTQGSTTSPEVTWTNDTDPTLVDGSGLGFSSITNGAAVLGDVLIPFTTETRELNELLIVVAGGVVGMSVDGETLEAIATNVFPQDAQISIAEYAGNAYMVGGGKAKILNPITREVTDWNATAGALPGATGSGTTSAFIVFAAPTGRIGLVDTRLITNSAIGDPLNFDTGDPDFGAAYVLGAGTNGRFGEPIKAVQVTTINTLLVCLQNSMFAIQGDPASGRIEQLPLSLDSGASGAAAVATTVEGVNIVHSPDGLHVVPSLSAPVNVSRPVLWAGITFQRETRDDYIVQCVREPRYGLLYIFLTRKRPTDELPSVAIVYDEKIGAYSAGQGGFFQDDYLEDLFPTASALYRGRVVLGCRDGYVRQFDETVTDDDGVGFDVQLPLTLIDEPGLNNSSRVRNWHIQLARGSQAVAVQIYGGETAEDVYDSTARVRIWNGKITAGAGPRIDTLMAPAIVFELSSAVPAASRWALEFIEADIDSVARLIPFRRKAAAPHAPCSLAQPFGVPVNDTDPPATPPTGGSSPVTPPGPPDDKYGGGFNPVPA